MEWRGSRGRSLALGRSRAGYFRESVAPIERATAEHPDATIVARAVRSIASQNRLSWRSLSRLPRPTPLWWAAMGRAEACSGTPSRFAVTRGPRARRALVWQPARVAALAAHGLPVQGGPRVRRGSVDLLTPEHRKALQRLAPHLIMDAARPRDQASSARSGGARGGWVIVRWLRPPVYSTTPAAALLIAIGNCAVIAATIEPP